MVRLWSVALALLVGAGLWAAPAQAQSEVEKLQREIKDLRSEIDGLKNIEREGEGADPELKTSLKKHVFSWSTEDGKFSLTMSVRTQFRMTYVDQFGQGNQGDRDDLNSSIATNGRDFLNFRVARLKLAFSGNIFEKEFQYGVTLNFSTGNAASILEQATFTWARWKILNVNAGQTKVPFNWSYLCSSNRQQFVDRSAASQLFNQDYGKGIWLSGQFSDDTPWIKYWVGVFNGVTRAANDFRNRDVAISADSFSAGSTAATANTGQVATVDAEVMPVIRLETHPMGDVAMDSVDMRSREESNKILFSVGIAVNWNMGRFNNEQLRPTGTATNGITGASGRFNTSHDTLHFTIDGHFRFYGLSVNIEYYWRHTEFHNHGPLEGNNVFANRANIGDLTDNGFTFEVGFFILPKQFDVGLRYSMVDGDEFWQGGTTDHQFGILPDMQEGALVVGYYLGGHNLKIQADLTYAAHQLVFTPAGNGAGQQTLPYTGRAAESRNSLSYRGNGEDASSDSLNILMVRFQIQWIF